MPPSRAVLEDATFLTEGGDGARRRMFFLETAKVRSVGARTACAIESASRLHPLWSVHYMQASTRFLSPFCPFARLLRTFGNDTILDLWLREGAYKRSPYETVHLSDGLRLGLLLKHGGVYVDFDVIFLRSLEDLGNAVVACSADDTVTNNFFAFTARHPFIQECLESFALDNTRRCRGVTLLPRSRLLPLNHTTAHLLFDAAAGPNVSASFARSYLVHTFHSRTRNIPAEHGSFVERAAAENCPRTFDLARRLHGHF
ncbi:hypothetical protein HPB52_009728 [Rhipicephalus sanguineus]|uniref:Alpha 1,4-glycosyltransferase domain-containing protein n=1 Tax=Rhipicephalus sanguineus TaxID=34632 RepID=A0A9D4PVI7_RHISA|nr:hypothetical protein HPB52_009728 [Rhipicephalus sanguineus]